MTTSVLLKAQHLETSSPKGGHRDLEVIGVEADLEARNQNTGKSAPQSFFYKVSLLLNLSILLFQLKNIKRIQLYFRTGPRC